MENAALQGVVSQLTAKSEWEKDPVVEEDLHSLMGVQMKLMTEGKWIPTRDDIREVGRIRITYGLAKQRDDEKYDEYLGRLIRGVESKVLRRVSGDNGESLSREEMHPTQGTGD